MYHDILLSYLTYIKQRGYCSMFIWACPPFQVPCLSTSFPHYCTENQCASSALS